MIIRLFRLLTITPEGKISGQPQQAANHRAKLGYINQAVVFFGSKLPV
jgi:hypothetical protein